MVLTELDQLVALRFQLLGHGSLLDVQVAIGILEAEVSRQNRLNIRELAHILRLDVSQEGLILFVCAGRSARCARRAPVLKALTSRHLALEQGTFALEFGKTLLPHANFLLLLLFLPNLVVGTAVRTSALGLVLLEKFVEEHQRLLQL
jgi:hypothetical protein